MAFYQLVKTQKLSGSINEVWNFIASPENLKEITPRNMGFIITSNNGSERMYPGMIITYKVSPMFGIKVNWVTEITHIKEYEYFVDEQRIGPYSMWHHQHKIEPVAGGVLMTDIVTYKPPFSFMGIIANSLFIRKRLQQIFDYRSIALEKFICSKSSI
jgi:ligand-binding SRPBCC domain-containing protein